MNFRPEYQVGETIHLPLPNNRRFKLRVLTSSNKDWVLCEDSFGKKVNVRPGFTKKDPVIVKQPVDFRSVSSKVFVLSY